MKQEDKNLLLIDLCARLPYKVMVHIRYNTKEPCYGELTPKDIQWFINSKIEEIKPYLRPMSSMTPEEFEEYTKLIKPVVFNKIQVNIASPESFDYLNKKMFDYRGLIPKGIALEALENMYN